MKKGIIASVILMILAVAGCRKIETDGEIQVVVVNGGGGNHWQNNYFTRPD